MLPMMRRAMLRRAARPVALPPRRLLSDVQDLKPGFNLKRRAESLGVHLTKDETMLLAARAGRQQDLRVTRRKFLKFAEQRGRLGWAQAESAFWEHVPKYATVENGALVMPGNTFRLTTARKP